MVTTTALARSTVANISKYPMALGARWGGWSVSSATAANGFEVGKSYNVIITAIVNGKTAKARIASFNLEQVSAPPSAPKAIFKI